MHALKSSIVWLPLILLLLPSAVHANLIANGSFEEGIDPGSLVLLPAGSTAINNWVVSSGTIDYIGALWGAAEGRRSVDLNGDRPGAFSQTFATVPDTLYEVHFAMAGNPDGAPSTKDLRVSAARDDAELTFDTAGHSRQQMGYVARTFLFTATSPTTTLTFTSLISGPYGPVIDNVTVEESHLQNLNTLVNFVSEPQSYETTADATGCPSGFVGKFFFTATLAPKQGSAPLSRLVVRVARLSNGNLLQNADGGPSGVGGLLTIPRDLDLEYRDGILIYPENIRDIPFIICLHNLARFTFLVDVFGMIEQTRLVSINNSATGSGNGASSTPSISADGRFVAFASDATNLVSNDNNNRRDVFVRNVQNNTTRLVSVNQAGTASGNGASDSPVISANGRFVAFVSVATDLTANDSNGTANIFVRDLKTETTILVSVNQAGTGGNDDSGERHTPAGGIPQRPVISADGRFVAFVSYASDLAPNDANGTADVFVRDLQNNATTLVSVNQTGTASGNGASEFSPAISADGRFVAFVSYAGDLAPNDTNGTADVFVRDLQKNAPTLASVNQAGTASGNGASDLCLSLGCSGVTSRWPTISADGRFVVFASDASDLVTNDVNDQQDVFVRDLQNKTTTLVSVNRAGTDGGNGKSDLPAISADGRFVVFVSQATDLVESNTNDFNIFIRDMQTGTRTLVSVNQGVTAGGNDISVWPSISADGRFVAFVSWATDLVQVTASHFSHESNVFVRDVTAGTTTLVSANAAETDRGNQFSTSAIISADGGFVTFVSEATDLVENDNNSQQDVFVRPVP